MSLSRKIAYWFLAYGLTISALIVLATFLPKVAALGAGTLFLWTAWQVFKPIR